MIDNKVVVSYDLCPTKSFKYYEGMKGDMSEYERLLLAEKREIREHHLTKVKGKLFNPPDLASIPKVNGFIKEITLSYADYKACVDLVEISDKGDLIPIVFSENDKVPKGKKIELQWIKLVFERNGFPINKARVFSANRQVNINLKNTKSFLVPILQNIEDFAKSPPRTVLNRHCKICEFKNVCREKLKALDDLSLIGRISRKQISQYEKKGIFTLNQLSYTYKLRKRSKKLRENYLFKPELQALSIRTKKVFIQKIPEFKSSECELYFDIEGISERQDYYLFGILICRNAEEDYQYYYSKGVDEESKLWQWFLKIISDYEPYPIYHYGDYELKVIKKLAKKYSTDTSRIINRFVNVKELL